MNRLLLILALVVFPDLSNASNAAGKFAGETYEHSGISICVIDHETGKIQVSLNKDQAIMPASLVKLVTTATALELLGPDHRFKTKLEYSGELKDGILNGDIYIRGGGDPGLGSRHFNENQQNFLKEWINAISKAGIKVINGNIIADPCIFDDEPVSPYWLWEDIANYYAAGIYGLGIFDNSFKLNLKSGKTGTRPEIESIIPPLPGLSVENRLLAASNNKDSAYFYGAPYQWNRILLGTIPSDRATFSIRGDIPDPPFYFANLLKETLMGKGIDVKGKPFTINTLPRDYNIMKETTLLYTELSVPLWRIIDVINKKSDNLFAEYLLRHIALTCSKKPASAREGLRVINDFWKKKGLDVSSIYMVDGCGLSPMDRISSDFLARLLDYMVSRSKYSELYEESLPLAGIQGSVSEFLKDTQLVGKVRLKSGTMQGVTCYAGYYRKNGRLLVVVMMINHMYLPRNQVSKDMEDFLLSL